MYVWYVYIILKMKQTIFLNSVIRFNGEWSMGMCSFDIMLIYCYLVIARSSCQLIILEKFFIQFDSIMSMCMEDDTRFLESKERENSFWFFVFIYQFFFYLNFINKNMRRNCSTQEDAIVFVFQVSTSRIETTSM